MADSPCATHVLVCLGAAVVVSISGGCNHSTPAAPSLPTFTSAPLPAPSGFTLSGTITEPIGTPISGVAVTTRANPSGGPSRTGTALTDDRGHYEIHDVAGCLWVKTTREGYEEGEWVNCVGLDRDQVFDTTMQPVTRIDAGTALDDRVLVNDMGWLVDILSDDGCDPCKIVRIVAPQAGTLSVTLTWPGRADAMSLWNSGYPARRFTGSNALVATFEVPNNREVMTYVAWDRTGEEAKEQTFHLESRMLVPGEPATAKVVLDFSTPTRFRAHRSNGSFTAHGKTHGARPQ